MTINDEREAPGVMGDRRLSATEQAAAAQQVRESVTALFHSRLEALQAAHDHVAQFDEASAMALDARVALEIELASYLAGAPRVSVGAATTLGSLLGGLGSIGTFLAHLSGPSAEDGQAESDAPGGTDKG